MANYQLLKADIDEKVYENAQQKITGANLNAVLNAMVTTLGAEYQFAGVATIDTNPENPDAKVFYIANGKGTYTNFGSLEVTEDEVVVLYWDSAWHKAATGIASQAKLSELDQQINGFPSFFKDPDNTLVEDDASKSFFASIREVKMNGFAEGVIYHIRLFGVFGDRAQITVTPNKYNVIDYTTTENVSTNGVQSYHLTRNDGTSIDFTFDWDRYHEYSASATNYNSSDYLYCIRSVDNKSIVKDISDLDTRVTVLENQGGTSIEKIGYFVDIATTGIEPLNTINCPVKASPVSGRIKSITIRCESAGRIPIFIGNIDQYFLFVVRNTYYIDVVAGYQTIDVSSMNIFIEAGERVAFQYVGKRYLTTLAGTPEDDLSFYYAESGNTFQLVRYPIENKRVVFSFGYEVESNENLILQGMLARTKEDVSAMQLEVGSLQTNQGVISDRGGNKYKLIVDNGALRILAMNFKHVLCVGNSYTIHPTTTDTESDYKNNLWWGHRAMASSSQSIAWTTLLQSILRTKKADAVVTPIFGRRYETNPSTYNLTNPNTFQYWSSSAWTSLANNLASFADVDAVFFFLGDNYGGDDWYSLYKPMVEKFMQWFPNATIFCGSCNGSSKVSNNNAIAQTAGETGATYVNMMSIGGASKMGNFVLDDANTLHQINNQAVANHIGDLGQYLMLERICPAIGYNNNVTLYDVTINGNATTKDSRYISGAIVSIFLEDGATSASVVDADGNAVIATDMGVTDYGHIFTFTMPSKNVTITIL